MRHALILALLLQSSAAFAQSDATGAPDAPAAATYAGPPVTTIVPEIPYIPPPKAVKPAPETQHGSRPSSGKPHAKAKLHPKAHPKPHPKAHPKPHPKAHPKPHPKAQPKAQPKAEMLPRPKAKAKAKPAPRSKAQLPPTRAKRK